MRELESSGFIDPEDDKRAKEILSRMIAEPTYTEALLKMKLWLENMQPVYETKILGMQGYQGDPSEF